MLAPPRPLLVFTHCYKFPVTIFYSLDFPWLDCTILVQAESNKDVSKGLPFSSALSNFAKMLLREFLGVVSWKVSQHLKAFAAGSPSGWRGEWRTWLLLCKVTILTVTVCKCQHLSSQVTFVPFLKHDGLLNKKKMENLAYYFFLLHSHYRKLDCELLLEVFVETLLSASWFELGAQSMASDEQDGWLGCHASVSQAAKGQVSDLWAKTRLQEQ